MGIKGGACVCRTFNYYKLTVAEDFYFDGYRDQKNKSGHEKTPAQVLWISSTRARAIVWLA